MNAIDFRENVMKIQIDGVEGFNGLNMYNEWVCINLYVNTFTTSMALNLFPFHCRFKFLRKIPIRDIHCIFLWSAFCLGNDFHCANYMHFCFKIIYFSSKTSINWCSVVSIITFIRKAAAFNAHSSYVFTK